jgi:hypothetical protein
MLAAPDVAGFVIRASLPDSNQLTLAEKPIAFSQNFSRFANRNREQ